MSCAAGVGHTDGCNKRKTKTLLKHQSNNSKVYLYMRMLILILMLLLMLMLMLIIMRVLMLKSNVLSLPEEDIMLAKQHTCQTPLLTELILV